MKKFVFSTALGSLVLASAQPVLAQNAEGAQKTISPPSEASGEEYEETDDVWFEESEGEGESGSQDDALAMAMATMLLTTMFEAEPLTAEAEARLPAATSVAASLVPEGVYGEMMGQMVDSFLGPIFEMADTKGGMSASDLSNFTGITGDAIDTLTDEERAELTGIFDPVHETREQAKFDGIISGVNTLFAVLEPGVRDGLARAYASKFEESELLDLQAFFATPVGAKYASQSLLLNSDPQVIAGVMKTIPSLIEQLPTLKESFESAGEGLPEPRRYDDLTPSEQRRASELLGVDQDTLRESMAMAEDGMAENMMSEDYWETVEEEATLSDSEADSTADALEQDATAEDEAE